MEYTVALMTEFDLGNDFLNVLSINLVAVMGIVGTCLDIGLG
jgi:hypothetical protein